MPPEPYRWIEPGQWVRPARVQQLVRQLLRHACVPVGYRAGAGIRYRPPDRACGSAGTRNHLSVPLPRAAPAGPAVRRLRNHSGQPAGRQPAGRQPAGQGGAAGGSAGSCRPVQAGAGCLSAPCKRAVPRGPWPAAGTPAPALRQQSRSRPHGGCVGVRLRTLDRSSFPTHQVLIAQATGSVVAGLVCC